MPPSIARSVDRRIAGWGLIVVLFVTVAYGVYQWSLRSGIDVLRATGMQRLAVYISSMEGMLGKYDYLPKTLELNKDVLKLLDHPGDPELVSAVSRYLEQVNEQAKSSAIYIVDLKGVTLAASNWNQPHSFVGVDLAFRPYVQDVLHGIPGTPGKFYGIGTTSNEAGYYFAHGIYKGTVLAGIATVKVSLEKLEKSWAGGADKVMLADENNVIFLSSIPALKYKTIGRLPLQKLERLEYTHQYYKQTLEPAEFVPAAVFADGSQIVSVRNYAQDDGEQPDGSDLLTQGRTPLQPDWRFLLLSDLSKLKRNAYATAAFAVAVLGFLMFVLLYLRQRQLAAKQSEATKEALQQAYQNLEQMVAERTSELHAAMQSLTQEIAERRQAEQALQTAQNELIQAGKMAVLGQMSAGITHELNQPLTALRTMSDNALVLLERGCIEDAGRNLAVIAQTVERMGTITRQLKMFSRKSTSTLAPVSIRNAIANALFLVDRRLRVENVSIKQIMDEDDVFVMGDNIRLEQVLVNLFSNALDSMGNCTHRCLSVEVRAATESVFIMVKDNGVGISEEVRQHLFEPFFTTKEQGVGLGLGLVISSQIVREFGGVLRGENAPDKGAIFTIELKSAATNEVADEARHA